MSKKEKRPIVPTPGSPKWDPETPNELAQQLRQRISKNPEVRESIKKIEKMEAEAKKDKNPQAIQELRNRKAGLLGVSIEEIKRREREIEEQRAANAKERRELKIVENLLASGKYDFMTAFSNDVAVAMKGDVYGVIDTEENIIVPFGKYDYIGNYSAEGLAGVKKSNDGGWAIIDTEGNEDSRFEGYAFISDFFYGVASFRKDGKFGVVDKNGNVLLTTTEKQEVDDFVYKNFLVRLE